MLKRAFSCGLPLSANTPISNCKHCDKLVELSINPKMVGVSLKRIKCLKLILKSNLSGRHSDRRDWQHRLWQTHLVKYGLGTAARSDCRRARATRHDCFEVLGASPAIPQVFPTIWMEQGDRQAGHLSSSNPLRPFWEKNSLCYCTAGKYM